METKSLIAVALVMVGATTWAADESSVSAADDAARRRV